MFAVAGTRGDCPSRRSCQQRRRQRQDAATSILLNIIAAAAARVGGGGAQCLAYPSMPCDDGEVQRRRATADLQREQAAAGETYEVLDDSPIAKLCCIMQA